MAQLNSINIRPGVNVLSVLPHLNYKAWYALAEFVDNAIQSSLDNQRELKAVDGADYRLLVEIRFLPQENAITIKSQSWKERQGRSRSSLVVRENCSIACRKIHGKDLDLERQEESLAIRDQSPVSVQDDCLWVVQRWA